MDICNTVKNNPETMLVVKARDLHAFAVGLIADARRGGRDENAESERLLTTAEVRELLHTSEASLHRWRKAGLLTPVRVGGENRYKKTDIDNFLNR